MNINYELIIIIGFIVAFVAFVIGVNWWSIIDNNKMLDRVYGKPKIRKHS